nr:hypothetical protein [Tanacetum cinerariifolium]
MAQEVDDRLGEIDESIHGLREEVEELTQVVLDRMSQLLSHHHLSHDRFDGTPYVYMQDIPDLGSNRVSIS